MGGFVQPVALTGSDQAVRTTECYFAGLAATETGGSSTATVRVYDHASAASGALIAAASLAAGGSADISLNRPVRCVNGIYVDVGGSGTVAGSIRIG